MEIVFEDLNFPFIMARALYYQGASLTEYVEYLDMVRARARGRIQSITAACGTKCELPPWVSFGIRNKAEDWKKRARLAELDAMSLIAYGVAQDIAGQIVVPSHSEVLAEGYCKELMEAAKDPNYHLNADDYRDTCAFLTVVLEGAKAMPNRELVRNARLTLLSVVARLEDKQRQALREGKTLTPLDRSTLKRARAHLDAARQIGAE
jgi:hypothetical protein